MTPSLIPFRILLVEDDIDDSIIFREALDETGLHTDLKIINHCTNILEVISTDASRMPHLIFLDLHMPKVSGHECLQSIRSLSLLNSIPIVIYTTSASSADVESTFQGGANLYLSKPSSFQLLVAALRKILTLDWNNYVRDRNQFKYKHTSKQSAG